MRRLTPFLFLLTITVTARPQSNPPRVDTANGELTISNRNHPLLTYVYATIYPPPGIDTAYKKSGFIHPLYTPRGQILTRIQPSDHYHHYGIWDPWTHILYKGDTIDCWNLAARKGTQRFAKFMSITSGLGWRATADWSRDNSEVLTSEGKDRGHADNTKARWCIVQGSLGAAYGGAALLSHPSNFNHPEPLRIWPDTSNGRGDLFANFSPTKDRDWHLESGHTYTLRYRWIVFNGHFTAEQAESAWQYFAHPPK